MGQPDRIIGTRVFGGYAITRKIGEGGMGAVYVAENHELRKKLAVKVLLPERLASKSATSRFLAEARAASAINHRNIIDILDSSTLEDGRNYILMEYLEGTTLRRYSRGIGPMPVDVVLAIMAQVCSGLQAAHDRGIVHRDLKPSNLFLAPQPDNPYFAKVLDFGIAKLDDPNLAGDVETKSHTIAGTPNYMAPEQARALRDVDHRADVYSIGAIVYELLSGQVPYKAASIGDLTYKQASTRPEPVRKLRPDLSAAWESLVMRAISLEPDARQRTISDLAFEMVNATEHGEAIARATASMLFAPSSSSHAPGERLRREGEREPEAMRSITASIGEGRPSPMAMSAAEGFSLKPGDVANVEETRAATPLALRTPSSLSQSQRRGSTSSGAPAGESPTTLGMSASQVPVHFAIERPTPWGRITAAVILLAAVTAIILVIVTDREPTDEVQPGAAVNQTPSIMPLAVTADAGAPDAALVVALPDAAPITEAPADGAPVVTTSSGKRKTGKGKRKTGKGKRKTGKGKGKGDGEEGGGLFDTRK